MAAARTRLLAPAALLARVEHGLALLRWDTPDLPPRHRTLRATLDWSHALLSSQEQAVFRRLGGFAGGFGFEAVAGIAATDELGVEPLDVLATLADKHLVRGLRSTGDAPRFGQPVTVREYARERLAESGEDEQARDRHLAYFVALAEQADRAMRGPDEDRWLRRLDREVDELRLAHEWAIKRGDAETEWRLVAALALFWVLRGYLREGSERVRAAMAGSYDADPQLKARFLEGAGMLAEWSRDDERAIAHYEGSLAAARAADDKVLAAGGLGRLGAVVYARGGVGRARDLVAEMLALGRAVDSGLIIGYAFLYQSLFAIGPHGSEREREQLRGELDEAVTRLRAAGFHRGLAELQVCRARLLVDVDALAATTALREALDLARRRADPVSVSFIPWIAIVMLVERLPAEQAARLEGAVAALAARSAAVGGRHLCEVFGSPGDRLVLERALATARETLGEAAFAAADAEGRVIAFEDLLDELLAVVNDGVAPLAPSASRSNHAGPFGDHLSPREREVLALVAAGHTNKQIAETLYLAPSTVKTHVASLLTKLDADNRAQLATITAQRTLARS